MAIEKTLVLLKPCTLQRGLAGEIISLFEKKGLQLCGCKMMQLTDEILSEHYAHLSQKPFFQRVKDSMMTAPVIALCLQGVDAIAAVRALAGPTNGRLAAPGTIRGSYCMSFQENIVHASDSPETAAIELKRFFAEGEIMEWKESNVRQVYNRSIQKITAFMNDTCPLYNPDGACKCRICKPVYSIDMDKEYAMVQRMMRLADLYRKFEKELPRKNYWEKFLQ